MRKLSTLTLMSVGATALMERGKLDLGKGRLMRGLRLIMRVLISNASGSSVTLTDTQRQAFLDNYRLTLSYGRNQRRKPFNSMRFTRLQRLSRYMMGSEWEGYGDSAEGLGRAMSTGNTHEVKLHVVIPTGYFWQLGREGRVFGVGRTQAKTFQLELKREADTLPTGVTVSGAVTFEVVPDDVSRPGAESFWYLPEWTEQDETDRFGTLPPGIPLLLTERSATLANSLLSDFSLWCDGEELHRGVSAQEAHAQALYDIPNVPAAADLADRETPLHIITPGTALRDLISGAFRFEQVTKTLTTAQLGLLRIPIVTELEWREDIQDAAGKNGRNKALKAVNAAVVDGLEIPTYLNAAMPARLFDRDDAEFERFPGLVSDGTGAAEQFIPKSVVERAQVAAATLRANGETKAAEQVFRKVSLATPGAVQDTRGFGRRGSIALEQSRATIETA